MNVLVTLVVIAAAAMWALAVHRRLTLLREQVKQAWKRLEPNQSDEAIRTVYNRHVAEYNAALGAFPANIVGPAAGFRRANPF
jgi:hypothetical protein